MLLQSFSALISDTLVDNSTPKYRVLSINHEDDNIKIFCETRHNQTKIMFYLKDIIHDNKLKFFSSQDILKLTNIFNQDTKISIKPNIGGTKYYNIISTWFVVCFILSNISALKLWDVFGYFTLDAGTLIFPLLYIMNDVITEVYGFSASRRTIYIALIGNIVATAFLFFITLLPNAQGDSNQVAFEQLFFLSPRIVLASLSSFFIGELINSTILSLLKLKYKGQFFALRAIFSTFIGASIESIIFCYIAFANTISNFELIKMMIVLTTAKIIYEIIIMPFTIRGVAFLKDKEKIEIFDTPLLKNLIKLKPTYANKVVQL